MLHEKLNCYRKSLELAEDLSREMTNWPRGFGYLADQMRRAMSSVILNCAEGNARMGEKDRKHFFTIARASIAEVGACMDLMKVNFLIPSLQHQNLKQKAHLISISLFRLK